MFSQIRRIPELLHTYCTGMSLALHMGVFMFDELVISRKDMRAKAALVGVKVFICSMLFKVTSVLERVCEL